ncbi:MAG: beta-N-acetylhexosaminidase [Pseudomonadota bacterium]
MNRDLEFAELDTKIGQLFMAGIPGTRLDEGTSNLIRRYHLGGVILFSRNIQDPVQLATLCRDLQDTAMRYHHSPLLLAIDQEGGRVARLKEPFTVFQGNAAIGMDPRPVEKAVEFAQIAGKEMKMVGLNMNLAPVVDVQRGEPEKHLTGRIFGEDPQRVALLGRTVIKTLQENGVMAVAKHFPGLGRTIFDPHFALPRIDIDMKEMEEVHLPPFREAIEEGVSGIMTSHAVYPALDSERPATLSSVILTDLLRDRMGFEGLIITDDLEMGAIAGHGGVGTGALNAFKAGADILLICKDQRNVLESIGLIKDSLIRGEVSVQRFDESNQRIHKIRSQFLNREVGISPSEIREYFNIDV